MSTFVCGKCKKRRGLNCLGPSEGLMTAPFCEDCYYEITGASWPTEEQINELW